MKLKENQRSVNGKVYSNTLETFFILEVSHILLSLTNRDVANMYTALFDMGEHFINGNIKELPVTYENIMGSRTFFVNHSDVKMALQLLQTAIYQKNKV